MSGPLVHVPYFSTACDQLIQPYLRLFGFSRVIIEHDGQENTSQAAYSNGEVLLDFSYWAEDFPSYCLMVDIGLVEGQAIPARSSVGLWSAIPPEKREPTYFRSEEQLVTLLSHICDEILPTYAKPLWTDTRLLRQLITRCYSEHDAKIELEEAEGKRRDGELAFKAGNFKESIKIYSALSPVDLTPTDLKRIEVARKKMNN